jgi:hypothetical protein
MISKFPPDTHRVFHRTKNFVNALRSHLASPATRVILSSLQVNALPAYPVISHSPSSSNKKFSVWLDAAKIPATKSVLEDCAVLQFDFSDRNSNTFLDASCILIAASNVEVLWLSVFIGITFRSNVLYCTRLYAKRFDARSMGFQVAHDLRCKIVHAFLGCVDMFLRQSACPYELAVVASRRTRLLETRTTKVAELCVYGDCVLRLIDCNTLEAICNRLTRLALNSLVSGELAWPRSNFETRSSILPNEMGQRWISSHSRCRHAASIANSSFAETMDSMWRETPSIPNCRKEGPCLVTYLTSMLPPALE